MFSNSPYSSTHLKNLPPKNWTPIIEKISQNTRHTRSTLNILGIAYINAFTTICEPGRKVLSVTRAHKADSRIYVLRVSYGSFFFEVESIVCTIFTLMPCHLEIALSGLRARNVLSDRNTLRFSFSSIKRLNMDTCSGNGKRDLISITFTRYTTKVHAFKFCEFRRLVFHTSESLYIS